MRFRRKVTESDGYPVRERRIVRTQHGDVVARPGDWVLFDATGYEYPIRKEVFIEIWEPVDDESKMAWKKVYGQEYKEEVKEEDDSVQVQEV